MPGGAALAGPTNIVGRIRRLCRHPAICPVALRLPGLQKMQEFIYEPFTDAHFRAARRIAGRVLRD
ncbi:hypothetical protein AM352_00255 [Citrobacter koseri]|nr:hypothetical protein AM352_00255 [Citrobacter koseri]PWY10939.1 hypothetical protein DL345_15535 [Citrobacter koseri]